MVILGIIMCLKWFYEVIIFTYSLLRSDLQQQAVFLRQLMQEANTILQELQQLVSFT